MHYVLTIYGVWKSSNKKGRTRRNAATEVVTILFCLTSFDHVRILWRYEWRYFNSTLQFYHSRVQLVLWFWRRIRIISAARRRRHVWRSVARVHDYCVLELEYPTQIYENRLLIPCFWERYAAETDFVEHRCKTRISVGSHWNPHMRNTTMLVAFRW